MTFCLFVCLSVSLSVCLLSVCYLFVVCLSFQKWSYRSFCLSDHLFACPSLCPLVCSSVCPTIYLPFVSLSVLLSISLSTCLSLFLALDILLSLLCLLFSYSLSFSPITNVSSLSSSFFLSPLPSQSLSNSNFDSINSKHLKWSSKS